MSNNWPVKPLEWTSRYDSSRHPDYLITKKFNAALEDHGCKLTWALAKPYIKNFRNAIDIGCREGEFTHFMQSSFQHNYCFDYRQSKYFEDNVLAHNVTWFATGLSNQAEIVLASGGGHLEATVIKIPQRIPVQLYALDDFNLVDIDFIKIDTDGFEMRIIQGALKTLENNNPVLVIEQGYYDKKEALSFCVNELNYVHVATCTRGLDHILIREV
jgi:FkbM family methyltransferase